MFLRMSYALFAGFTYVIFLLTFLYLVAFLVAPPLGAVQCRPWRAGEPSPPWPSPSTACSSCCSVANTASAARPAFKRMWTQIVPRPIERSVYVLAASLALILLLRRLASFAVVIWSVEDPFGQGLLWGLFVLGWTIVLLSTFLISHFELFGLRQVWQHITGQTAGKTELRQPFLYKLVRHPLYLGFFRRLLVHAADDGRPTCCSRSKCRSSC